MIHRINFLENKKSLWTTNKEGEKSTHWTASLERAYGKGGMILEDRRISWRSGSSLVRRSSQWLSRKKGCARGSRKRGQEGQDATHIYWFFSFSVKARVSHSLSEARTHRPTNERSRALSLARAHEHEHVAKLRSVATCVHTRARPSASR